MSVVLDDLAIRKGSYYTDGRRLYRIEDICTGDETVFVENCSTEFKAWIALKTVSSWEKVKPKNA